MTNRNSCVYQNPIAESIFKEALLLLLCCVRQKLVRGRIRLAGIFLALAPLCGQEVARMALGAAIAVKNDQIRKIKENRYGVRSQTAGSGACRPENRPRLVVQLPGLPAQNGILQAHLRRQAAAGRCACRRPEGSRRGTRYDGGAASWGTFRRAANGAASPTLSRRDLGRLNTVRPDTSSSTAARTAGGDLSSGRDSRGCGTIRRPSQRR